ncbi:MAG TPA: patatin-like phospholipase family protein [Azonexus sp.]|nr:patatin-like phospholipase family protein [Azonexus sp.]
MNPLTRQKAAAAKAGKAPKTIAIACQGGGSHTAFTGGVMQVLLRNIDPAQHRIIAISGTSGGAICAAIAWYGLLQNDPEGGAQLLESFWHEMSSHNLPDAFSNHLLVWLQRSAGYLALPEVSPYHLPVFGQNYFANIIKKHIDFTQLPDLVKSTSPHLLLGAVEVLSGKFTVFSSHHEEMEKRITASALLASAAIPELFRAVQIGDDVYWDGLFSQNPPIRGFFAGQQPVEAKPDEIWVIQINPDKQQAEPRMIGEINDRRNELAGNLSLNQELFFVDQANEWLGKGWLPADHFKHVEIRKIPLTLELDYPSKLDRNPAFISHLMAEGRRVGAKYLHRFSQA